MRDPAMFEKSPAIQFKISNPTTEIVEQIVAPTSSYTQEAPPQPLPNQDLEEAEVMSEL